WYGSDMNLPFESFAQLAELLREAAIVGKHPLSPREHSLTFRCESHKSLPPLHDENTQALLELLDAGSERRLRDVACRCRSSEVTFARERNDVFEVPDDHSHYSSNHGCLHLSTDVAHLLEKAT